MASRQASKVTDETNPCSAEGAASMKCLSKNNYNKEACGMYFENYNNCKKFWGQVQRARRIAGIYPLLPPIPEREGIKEKYKETGKIPVSP